MRLRLRHLLPLLLLSGACSSGPVLVENDQPKDYWFQFLDQGYLSGPAELWAQIKFATGEELRVHLTAASNMTAGQAALLWAQQLNRSRPLTSNSAAAGFSIRQVLRIELQQGMRGLQYRAMTPEESAAPFEPSNPFGIHF